MYWAGMVRLVPVIIDDICFVFSIQYTTSLGSVCETV